MKIKLIIVIVLTLLAGGYVYASYNNLLPAKIPAIPKETIDQATNKVPSFNSFQGTSGEQLETFSDRAKELGNFAQDAFKNTIQEDTTQPVHEKAIEYGQYIYCKQVVESYETSQSPTPKTTN
jgi:hypothetical protein